VGAAVGAIGFDHRVVVALFMVVDLELHAAGGAADVEPGAGGGGVQPVGGGVGEEPRAGRRRGAAGTGAGARAGTARAGGGDGLDRTLEVGIGVVARLRLHRV